MMVCKVLDWSNCTAVYFYETPQVLLSLWKIKIGMFAKNKVRVKNKDFVELVKVCLDFDGFDIFFANR